MSLAEYIEAHSSPEGAVLEQITRNTHLEVINPRMLSGHVQGRVLSMLSKMIRPKRILELGTFTGYSALCLAEGLVEDGRLITIEHNDEMEDAIRRNLALSPLGEKIELVIGDAKEWLREFRERSQASYSLENAPEALQLKGGELFDLVFIDADKKEYCEYLDLVLPLMNKGGWILADNTLWDGHIIDPAYDKDKQTVALRAFNDKVAEDERLEKVILPLRDGLTIIRVK
jgi:predicted O-methyltransferase YrrM